MTAAAVAAVEPDPVGRAAQPRFRFLESNLESLSMPPATRQSVREAEPRGRVELQSDGAPYLRVGPARLGGELSTAQVFEQLKDVPDNQVILIFGMGAGQLPRIARSMCRVPIVVYEPDPSLLRTLLEYGPLDLGSITIVSSIVDLVRIWREFAARVLDVRVLTTPGYHACYPDEARAFVEAVPGLLQRTAVSKVTFHNRAKVWISDIIANVELLTEAPPFLTLRGRYRGVPAFIVGAGPSLDKNVALLNRAAQKGIVFATNSGAVSLGKHAVEPQVVVCIESIDASSKLRDLPFISHAVRAFSLTAAPQTLRTGSGPLLPMHELVPQYDGPLEELTGQPGLPVSGSVSTMAFSLARALGCSPIVLVGQDLAYTDGRTYASGTGYESSTAQFSEQTGLIQIAWNEEALRVHGQDQGVVRDREQLRRVPAWGGEGEVDSGASFANVQDWFRQIAELIEKANTSTRLVNCTEGGVHIAGFEDVPLARLLEGLPERGIDAAQMAAEARALWTPIEKSSIVAWLEAQAGACRSVRLVARRVRRYARHASLVTLTGEPRRVRPAYDRLEQAEAKIRAAVNACPLVDAWAHRAIEEALSAPESASATALTAARAAAGQSTPAGPHREACEATERSARIAMAIEQAARELQGALLDGAARLANTAAH